MTSPRRRAQRLLVAGGPSNTIWQNVLFVLGAAAVALSAGIHLHLWMDGYSVIHIIGPLFLAQSIAGFVLALGVLAVRRVLTAVLGLGYALATIAGFLLSVNVGLFGFQDTWSASFARPAFWVEIAASVIFLIVGASCALRAFRQPPGPPSLETAGR